MLGRFKQVAGAVLGDLRLEHEHARDPQAGPGGARVETAREVEDDRARRARIREEVRREREQAAHRAAGSPTLKRQDRTEAP